MFWIIYVVDFIVVVEVVEVVEVRIFNYWSKGYDEKWIC